MNPGIRQWIASGAPWVFDHPFFIILNYLGWFRADALEEIVGLDISYHGGSYQSAEAVKDEHLAAFNKRKKDMLRRRSSGDKRSSHSRRADTFDQDGDEEGGFGRNGSVDNIVAH